MSLHLQSSIVLVPTQYNGTMKIPRFQKLYKDKNELLEESICGKSGRLVSDSTRVVTKIEMARHITGTNEPSGEDQVL